MHRSFNLAVLPNRGCTNTMLGPFVPTSQRVGTAKLPKAWFRKAQYMFYFFTFACDCNMIFMKAIIVINCSASASTATNRCEAVLLYKGRLRTGAVSGV